MRILCSRLFWRWAAGMPLLIGLIIGLGWTVFFGNPSWCRWIYIFQAYYLEKGTVLEYMVQTEADFDSPEALPELLLGKFTARRRAPCDIGTREIPFQWDGMQDDKPSRRITMFTELVEEEEAGERWPRDYIEQPLRLMPPPKDYTGAWRSWYRSGGLASVEEFVGGCRVRLELYLPGGECIQREAYYDGLMDGDFKISGRFEDADFTEFIGRTGWIYEGHMRMGRPHGKWIMRAETGLVRVVGHYLLGVRHGQWTEWDEGKNRLLDGVYRKGKPWSGTFLTRQQPAFLARLVEIREGRPWNGCFLYVTYKDGKRWRGIGSRLESESNKRIDVCYWDGKAVSEKEYRLLSESPTAAVWHLDDQGRLLERSLSGPGRLWEWPQESTRQADTGPVVDADELPW